MDRVPLHCFCGTDFFLLAALCAHVSGRPACLHFWGGNITNLSKKVLSVRNASSYQKKKGTLKESRVVRLEEKNSELALKEFEEAGRYGPIFACISCHELNWRSNVDAIDDLSTVDPAYIEREYVSIKHRNLFFKINSFYLCLTCKQSINASRMPRRCAKNLLLCPWEHVDDEFLRLNEVENSLLVPYSLYHYLNFKDTSNRQKTVMVPAMYDHPTNKTATVAVLKTDRVVQPQSLLRAHEFLAIQCNNPYVEANSERLAQLLGSAASQPGEVINLPLPIGLDVIEQNRTNLGVLSSVFLPDQSNVDLNPVNFLDIKHPFAKAFPIFFPDSQGDFDCDERRFKVSETEFVSHYLKYVRKQLAEFSPFIFHSLFRIDTFRTTASTHAHRGYSVLGNVDGMAAADPGSKFRLSKLTGSSSYYHQIHEDLQAKCDQLGYPEYFYTFSNSDQWDVSLAAALSQDGYDVWHIADEARCFGGADQHASESSYFVHLHSALVQNCPFHANCYRVPADEVLSEVEKSKLMSRNIYSSNRIFNARVRQLIDNVMMSRSSCMGVRVHHTVKEFGDNSGWVHCHGVAWRRNGEAKSAFDKVVRGQPLTKDNERHLCNLAATSLSVRLSASKLKVKFKDLNDRRASDIISLAKRLQVHPCTAKCSFDDGRDGCYYEFPRLPSEYFIITAVPEQPSTSFEREERVYLITECNKVKKAVSNTILNLNSTGHLQATNLLQLLLQALGDVDSEPSNEGCYRWKGGVFAQGKKFDEWQDIIGDEHPHQDRHKILFSVYYTALSTATRMSTETQALINELVLVRDVSETFVATYNPYLLEAMRSNMEVSLVLYTPEVLLKYITKSQGRPDSSHIAKRLREDKAISNTRDISTRIKTMREVSEAEAYFRLDRDLSLSSTNLTVEWVNTAFPGSRTCSFKLDDGPDGIPLPGKPGHYVRTSGWLDKFEEKIGPLANIMSPRQFVMFYRLSKPDERERLTNTEVTHSPTTTFYIVTHGELALTPIENRPLPSHIFLRGGSVMVLRKKPVCIDMPQPKTRHASMYATLLMNLPWSSEVEYLGDAASSEESCQAMWDAEQENCLRTSEDLRRMLQHSLLS